MRQLFKLLLSIFSGFGESTPEKTEKKENSVVSEKEQPIVVSKKTKRSKHKKKGLSQPVMVKSKKDKIMNKYPELVIADIVQIDFPADQYYKKETAKNQAVLHHTVSGQGVRGDIRTWLSNTVRVATHVIIGQDGTINQCYSTRYWAHHIGVKSYQLKKMGLTGSENKGLNMHSVGIEIDSYGGLKKENGIWKTVYGTTIADDMVVEYPEGYRGYYGYERYTEKQIEAVMSFLIYLNKTYGISLRYHEDMWDVSKAAMSGENGIWTHTSYRSDKSDCHPQPELIEALKSLEQYETKA